VTNKVKSSLTDNTVNSATNNETIGVLTVSRAGFRCSGTNGIANIVWMALRTMNYGCQEWMTRVDNSVTDGVVKGVANRVNNVTSDGTDDGTNNGDNILI
jgi:hypothetical protein